MYRYFCNACDRSDGKMGPTCTLTIGGEGRPVFCPVKGHRITWEETDMHISALHLTEDQFRSLSQDIKSLGGEIDIAGFPTTIHAHLPNTDAVARWMSDSPLPFDVTQRGAD